MIDKIRSLPAHNQIVGPWQFRIKFCMALRAGGQCLPIIARRGKLTLGWGSALAAGIAIISVRTGISSHGASGNIRARYGLNLVFRPISTYLPQYRFFSPLFSSDGNAMALAPPQPPLEWNHGAEDITRLTKDAVEDYRKVMDSVGRLDAKDCTFESVSLWYTVHRSP
jgi:hypothetical protein